MALMDWTDGQMDTSNKNYLVTKIIWLHNKNIIIGGITYIIINWGKKKFFVRLCNLEHSANVDVVLIIFVLGEE